MLTALETEKQIDDISWQLLCLLQENARLSFAELGRRVGLTSPAVAERVARLEDAGIIKGYRAEINPQKVGLGITAFIRINCNTIEGCAHLGAIVKDVPEVLECHRVTGSDSGIMKVVVSSVGHLESLIDRLSIHGTLTTSLVLSSPIKDRIITSDLAHSFAEEV